MINIGASIIIFLLMIFTKIYLFFISTRIANIRDEGGRAEKGYKKHYYNFLFLNGETDCASWYSKHQMVLNLIKDPFLAFCLVYFSNSPGIQVGTALLIIAGYFGMEVAKKPMLQKKENARNQISLGIYSLTTLFFLILVFS